MVVCLLKIILVYLILFFNVYIPSKRDLFLENEFKKKIEKSVWLVYHSACVNIPERRPSSILLIIIFFKRIFSSGYK